MEKLQGLLSAERQKEFQAHVSGQEKETEIQHLRQQLSRLETDRLSLSEQLRTLRSEVKLKDEEIQRLKSELASERFQREHAKQQLVSERAQLTLTTTKLAASPRLVKTTPSPDPSSSTTQVKQQKREEKDEVEKEGSDMFSQEQESVASDSARTCSDILSHKSCAQCVLLFRIWFFISLGVVGELLSSSSASSSSSGNQPS